MIALLTVGLVGLGLWQLTNRPATVSRLWADLGLGRENQGGPLVASGFIEADAVTVASEAGGRVVSLTVAAGDTVVAGQGLLGLDATLLDAQIEAAAAAVEVAQARRDQVAAGVRAETLTVAETELARARAVREAAHQAWQDAQLLRDNPQALQVEIAAARARLRVAEHQLTQAEALRDAAAVGYEGFEATMEQLGPEGGVEVARGPLAALAPLLQQILPPDVYQAVMGGADGTYSGGGYKVVVGGGLATVYKTVPLQLDFHLLPNAYWQAGTAVNVAQAARDGALAALDHLYALADDPQAAQAQVDAAYSAYRTAQAGVDGAQAALETLQAGASEQELALADAQVQEAQAALATLETQRARRRLVAPRAGLVTQQPVSLGELAAPGAPLLTIADLSQVTLTVYVPLADLGRVQRGQAVEVRVDSFPARVFKGTVVAVAAEAEFTPSSVQTQEERVNLVFAVEIRLPNPDGALKPGMPADATFVKKSEH